MHLINIFWTSITYVTNILTLSPFEGPSGNQQAPLLGSLNTVPSGSMQGPIFKPPSGPLVGPGSEFTCDYSSMVGFSSCSTAEDRGCWLRNETGFEYNINTDYKDTNLTPIAIHRTYTLNITDEVINADGLDFTEGKVFNATYPGPWIQACWGDVCAQPSLIFSPYLSFGKTNFTALRISTERHGHSKQPPQIQWDQHPLAWNSPMANDAHGWS